MNKKAIIQNVLFGAADEMDAPMASSLFVTTLFGVSMPTYWLGLMFIILFAVHLNWLPARPGRRGH